jgi:hypothetical protein
MVTQNNDNKKVAMPSIAQVLTAIERRGMFTGFKRYQYTQYDVGEALKIVEAIGKSRYPGFCDEMKPTHLRKLSSNCCHCGHVMQCLDPDTKASWFRAG